MRNTTKLPKGGKAKDKKTEEEKQKSGRQAEIDKKRSQSGEEEDKMNAIEISLMASDTGTAVEIHVPGSMETQEMLQTAQENFSDATALEQQEMEEMSRQAAEKTNAEEMAETQEMLGYSSDYYEHKMSSALESGNKIAYEHAKEDWADAKVKEECK